MENIKFIGQEKLVENLYVYCQAAIAREEVLDHTIISGKPGMGKTTLAKIISNKMNSEIIFTNGTNFEKQANLISVISRLKEGQILFIDEIHRINKNIEEILEDFLNEVLISLETLKNIYQKKQSLSVMR